MACSSAYTDIACEFCCASIATCAEKKRRIQWEDTWAGSGCAQEEQLVASRAGVRARAAVVEGWFGGGAPARLQRRRQG